MTQRVLFIDDDPVARSVVSSVLEGAGLHVHAIASPIGATRTIRDEKIDVVICDLNMPAMQGDAFARLFRENRLLRHLPLVLLSGAPREQLEELMSRGTIDAVVHKSEIETSLVSTINRLSRR